MSGIATITNAGLAAAFVSEADGYATKINITGFKIGSTHNVTPSGLETDVLGSTLHTGDLTDMTVTKVGTSTLVYKIRLDKTVGDFDIGNIGLFTDTGVLFALLVYPRTRPKEQESLPDTAGNIIEIQLAVIYTNLAEAVDLSLTTNAESDLPTVTLFTDLPTPSTAAHSVYLVTNNSLVGGPSLAFTDGSAWYYSRLYATTLNAADVVSTPAGTLSATNVQAALNELDSDIQLKAPLVSPAFTGAPTAPTASVGTSTTQLATTEFVIAQIAAALAATGIMLSGNGVPTSGTGSNGQFYARLDTPGGIYGPKASGAWPSSPIPGTSL